MPSTRSHLLAIFYDLLELRITASASHLQVTDTIDMSTLLVFHQNVWYPYSSALLYPTVMKA